MKNRQADEMKNGHLRVLHTSDWHLGHVLFDRKRDDEFEFFFNWLINIIKKECIDCLLIAGDVFDTTTPSAKTQGMYLKFLIKARDQGCKHLVITSGNHDPAILLEVHKPILERMDIHVLGIPDVDKPENEVIVFENQSRKPALIVCAVPFLREKYLRRSAPGESPEDKERKLLQAIADHYGLVAEKASAVAGQAGHVPIIAMGHLFAGGNARLKEGECERQLYVGTLGQIGPEVFGEIFDYVALGHLHMPQQIGQFAHIRYSGSPLPMGFSEAGHQKSVCLLDFDGNRPTVELLPVPEFRHLERVEGNLEIIANRIHELSLSDKTNGIWLEIIYNGDEYEGNLRERLEELVAGTGLEILGIKNNRLRETILGRINEDEELGDLEESMVFERCLKSKNIPEEKWPQLLNVFQEVVLLLKDEQD